MGNIMNQICSGIKKVKVKDPSGKDLLFWVNNWQIVHVYIINKWHIMNQGLVTLESWLITSSDKPLNETNSGLILKMNFRNELHKGCMQR